MQKVFETLIKLQKVDSRLKELDEAKGGLPQKVKEMEADCDAAKKALQTDIDTRAGLETEKRSAEAELEDFKEKLKKFKTQLYQVKTNKEYDAITVEIETSEKSIDELEMKILELDDKITEYETKVEELDKVFNEKQDALEKNKSELQGKLDLTQEKEDELLKMRDEIAQNLTRPVLSTYDRIRKGRDGMAVACLIGGACEGCSSRVPPQRALEIRMQNNMHMCEVCGRFLVWDPEMEKAATLEK